MDDGHDNLVEYLVGCVAGYVLGAILVACTLGG